MPLVWLLPVETSAAEERILSRCKKAKLFILLRRHRHELFDEGFQLQLAAMYPERTSGKDPVPPAMLAMVTILQAWLGFSDEEAVEYAEMDKRWQMLLGVLGEEKAPFSQGALFNFRQRLMAHDLDRQFIDRTVALARTTRGFSHTALRAAFDASPLFGAGRVEDTFNLLGHAIREVLRTVADRLGVEVEEAATRAGVPLVVGSSLKAALDIDWDDPSQKKDALERLLGQVRALETFLRREMSEALEKPPLKEQWATVAQILSQDIEPDPEGGGARIHRGVAKERRVSVRDGEMRHGRKSKSTRFDGYKRHLGLDLDAGLIVAAAVTPANRPEGEASPTLFADVDRQGFTVEDCHIDRGYLAAEEIARRTAGMRVHCKAFPLRNHGRFTKADFQLDLATQRITCPAGATVPLVPGSVARFPTATCAPCSLRANCTTARHRSVSIHPQEPFLVELRARQRTPDGRAELRQRIPVEHSLARLGATQGKRARYVGSRKNLFDVRRHAAVFNLFAAAA